MMVFPLGGGACQVSASAKRIFYQTTHRLKYQKNSRRRLAAASQTLPAQLPLKPWFPINSPSLTTMGRRHSKIPGMFPVISFGARFQTDPFKLGP